MNIFGIYCQEGIPVCVLLAKDYDNSSHENHVEIARRFAQGESRRYACILFCFRDDTSAAYTF